MKIKKILLDALIDLAVLFVGLWPAYFAGNGFVGLIARLISENEDQQFARIAEFWTSFLILLAIMFLFHYKLEYKREKFKAHETAISAALACGVWLLVGALTVFTVWSCGPALPLSKAFYAGSDKALRVLDTDLPRGLCVGVSAALDVFYIAAAILGGRFGKKKRNAEREKLTGRQY